MGHVSNHWIKDAGYRIQGSGLLDSSKVQAPSIVISDEGRYHLFYTAVGPGRPYSTCQGYIMSAQSDDGLEFTKDPGIRLAPDPEVPCRTLRVLSPTITRCSEGYWRMYVECRGKLPYKAVICSALSEDLISWTWEPGIRLQLSGPAGGPRYLSLPKGGGRLYCCTNETESGTTVKGVVSACSPDGLNFFREPGWRMCSGHGKLDSSGITAAEVIPNPDGGFLMFYSAWQDVPPGTKVPPHPSTSPDIPAENFAEASIKVDIAGYRSRIFLSRSNDALAWDPPDCIISGAGYDSSEIDAVHAEDMSVINIGDDTFRVYYAACSSSGKWGIASAHGRTGST
jgi:hypothetical protein